MKCSICIATYNKAEALQKTLDSIVTQDIPFDWEIIVVDDGSPESDTYNVCDSYGAVQYTRINRSPRYRNPAVARNVAYQQAKGEVIICQSDDVIHHTSNSVENLVNQLQPGTFVLAKVINVDPEGNQYSDPTGEGYGDRLQVYVSPQKNRPLFFLGALFREDLYAVGGNDEEFEAPSGEDRWFALCLINGRNLRPVYLGNVIGHHQAHNHCDPKIVGPSQRLVQKKTALARRQHHPWCSTGGPWSYP